MICLANWRGLLFLVKSVRLRTLLLLGLCMLCCSCSKLKPLSESERKQFYAIVSSYPVVQADPEKVCRVHQVPTQETGVEARSGFRVFPTSYQKQLVRRFPNAYSFLWTGSCEGVGFGGLRYYCQPCRDAEARYWKREAIWSKIVFWR